MTASIARNLGSNLRSLVRAGKPGYAEVIVERLCFIYSATQAAVRQPTGFWTTPRSHQEKNWRDLLVSCASTAPSTLVRQPAKFQQAVTPYQDNFHFGLNGNAMNQVLETTKLATRFKKRPKGQQAKPFKIICPGLSRTGTTSLSRALNILGFHNNEVTGEWYLTKWQDDRLVFDPDVDIATCFDAYGDSPVPLVYQELVDLYPGSKIILTTRDIDAWLPSMKHLLDTVFFALESQAGKTKYAQMLKEAEAYNLQMMGAARFDEGIYAARFKQYYKEVREFFVNRPEPVLELDITQQGGGGWSQLCNFLGVPEPDQPFPWKNKSGLLKKFLLKSFLKFFPLHLHSDHQR